VNQGHQVLETLNLCQIVLFSRVEETHVYLDRKPSTVEGGASRICFSLRIELVFERNTACQSGFSRSRRAHFLPNKSVQLS
jgi:hypothetical protein